MQPALLQQLQLRERRRLEGERGGLSEPAANRVRLAGREEDDELRREDEKEEVGGMEDDEERTDGAP